MLGEGCGGIFTKQYSTELHQEPEEVCRGGGSKEKEAQIECGGPLCAERQERIWAAMASGAVCAPLPLPPIHSHLCTLAVIL